MNGHSSEYNIKQYIEVAQERAGDEIVALLEGYTKQKVQAKGSLQGHMG
jgi:hypothetical protein